MKSGLNCYCLSGQPFDTCCHPFLSGKKLPRNPEQLMRSRFSAFCARNYEYLFSTHHPSKRAPDEREQLLNSMAQTQWLGLKIINAKKPGKDHDIGFVEFTAFYEKRGIAGQVHENSRFLMEDGQWFYLDGELLDPVSIGRNAPCFCNSGKKFKRCHGR